MGYKCEKATHTAHHTNITNHIQLVHLRRNANLPIKNDK